MSYTPAAILKAEFLTQQERRIHMLRTCTLFTLIVVLAGAGCPSQSKFLDSKQPMARQTAMGLVRNSR